MHTLTALLQPTLSHTYFRYKNQVNVASIIITIGVLLERRNLFNGGNSVSRLRAFLPANGGPAIGCWDICLLMLILFGDHRPLSQLAAEILGRNTVYESLPEI